MTSIRPRLRHFVSLALLAGVVVGTAQAAPPSCKDELGEERAAQLVKQCLALPVKKRAVCTVSQRCQRIDEAIQDACWAVDHDKAPFCDLPVKNGTYNGTLVAGGGVDINSVTVRLDDGNRIHPLCDTGCGDWFEPSGEGEAERLKRAYLGKRVSITVRQEPNGERQPGEDKHQVLLFAKKISFIK